MLKYCHDRYKTQEMCHKAISNYPFILKYCRERHKIQEMCDKAVSDYPFMLKYCRDRYKTQEMCDKAVSNYPFILKYCHDRYNTFFFQILLMKISITERVKLLCNARWWYIIWGYQDILREKIMYENLLQFKNLDELC